MFAPHAELAHAYAELIRNDPTWTRSCVHPGRLCGTAVWLDPATGSRRRVMMLLFEGENAIQP